MYIHKCIILICLFYECAYVPTVVFVRVCVQIACVATSFMNVDFHKFLVHGQCFKIWAISSMEDAHYVKLASINELFVYKS